MMNQDFASGVSVGAVVTAICFFIIAWSGLRARRPGGASTSTSNRKLPTGGSGTAPPLAEGTQKKGGHNPSTPHTKRPPPPGGSRPSHAQPSPTPSWTVDANPCDREAFRAALEKRNSTCYCPDCGAILRLQLDTNSPSGHSLILVEHRT